jgi:hypothetical protein
MATTLSPDTLTPLEDRAGVDALGNLHQRRRQLLVTLAPLKAMHGHNGIWDDKRKSLLEAMKVKARMSAPADKKPPTDAAVEAMAYADPQYVQFIDDGIAARIDYINQQNELTELEERIRSREIELLCYNGEIKLSR